jgi:hypothetical protein
MREDYQGLMKVLDGHDTFVTGHQIIKTAGATLHNQRVQNTPEWTRNDAEVRKLLLIAFPRLNEDSTVGRKQRIRAARWLRVIHLYYRMGWTASKVSGELGVNVEIVKNTYKSICRVFKGLTANNKKRVKSGAGRPKIVTPYEQ